MRFFISLLVLLALLTFTGCGMKITHVDHVDHVDTHVAAKKTPPGNAYGLKKNKHFVHEKTNR